MSRILIVEDEVAIADLEKDYLELSGNGLFILYNQNLTHVAGTS